MAEPDPFATTIAVHLRAISVRFERPTRVTFRLVRGPVPHVVETFELEPDGEGTTLTWQGELGADFWGVGRWWGGRVAQAWERTVRASLEGIRAEAERRAVRDPA